MTTTPAQRKAKLAKIEAAIKSGLTVADAAKKQGIHQVTYYAWRKAANGNGATDFKVKPGVRSRLTRTNSLAQMHGFDQLQAENARLRALLGELLIEKALQSLIEKALQSHPTI